MRCLVPALRKRLCKCGQAVIKLPTNIRSSSVKSHYYVDIPNQPPIKIQFREDLLLEYFEIDTTLFHQCQGRLIGGFKP